MWYIIYLQLLNIHLNDNSFNKNGKCKIFEKIILRTKIGGEWAKEERINLSGIQIHRINVILKHHFPPPTGEQWNNLDENINNQSGLIIHKKDVLSVISFAHGNSYNFFSDPSFKILFTFFPLKVVIRTPLARLLYVRVALCAPMNPHPTEPL